MTGILRIAFKLLVNDRGKFAALIMGITFAVFLMVQMTSLFAGILNKSSSTVINIGAKVWVMDPAVQTVINTIPMPDYVLDAVRSIDGVQFAVPLYSGGALVKLRNGNYQAVTVMGLDDSTLYGRPMLSEGKIEDIYNDNAFIVVRDAEYRKLGSPPIGTTFELNDHRGVISGIATVASSGLFGIPTLYTVYTRAIQYIPSARFTLGYVLIEPKSVADVPYIQEQVRKLGYLALTKNAFMARIADFYKYQTSAAFWSFGASLSAPLFHGGTLWFQRKAAMEAFEASLASYRQTVLNAFVQIADVMRALEHDAQNLVAQAEAVKSASEALKLLQSNFEAGTVDYLQVLTADTQYQQAKLAYLQAEARRLSDTTAFFLAMGGGWWKNKPPPGDGP